MNPLTTRTAPPPATPAAGERARPDELAGSSPEVDKKLILEVAELSVDYAGAASATAVDKVSFQLSQVSSWPSWVSPVVASPRSCLPLRTY